MFTLQIQCATLDEAERIIAALKYSANPAVVDALSAQLPFSDPAGLSDAESPAAKHFPETTNTAAEKPKNPRGRPRREVAEKPAAPAALEASGGADVGSDTSGGSQQAPTLDDARAALKGVQAKYGTDDMAKPLEVLGKFSAGRISEVKPEQYPAFIAACKAA